MAQIFGTRWTSTFGETPTQAWRVAITDLSGKEIARGVNHCLTKHTGEWPPAPGMFRNYCRPAIDYEAAFIHAVHQLAMRRAEREQDWNCGQPNISPEALFWACSSMSGDMLTGTFEKLRSRWKVALDMAVADQQLQPIPAMAPRISRKHGGPTETGKQAIEDIRAVLMPRSRKPDPVEHCDDDA